MATSFPVPGTAPAPPSTTPTRKINGSSHPESGAESVLTPGLPERDLPAETANRSTTTQIYEGTNQSELVLTQR